jgi:hypothetical protein
MKENYREFTTEEEFEQYLLEITGQHYSFAVASSRKVGKNVESGMFYQLMPEGNHDAFFDWYCGVRADFQFFPTRWACAMMFVKYWIQWKYGV